MKNTRQAKGGKAKTPAKKAAARENGKLGGRPRKADRAKAPHLFVGTFGYNIDPENTDDGHSDDTRFTALIEATDIKAAIRGFRRILQHPTMKDSIGDNYVELLSCCEVAIMPPAGFIAFIEHSYRNPVEPDYRSSIYGTCVTLPKDHVGVEVYGYTGAFKKGKHYVQVTRDDEDEARTFEESKQT